MRQSANLGQAFLRWVAPLLAAAALAVQGSAQERALDDLLARTTTQVTGFVDQFSHVKCTELVSQIRLKKNGGVEYKEESSFENLLILRAAGGELAVSETRTAGGAAKRPKALPLLVTNGFSTVFLIFHPVYRSGFEFTRDSDEVLDGRKLTRVRFRHVHGMRSPTVLVLRGREYPLDLAGMAWIEPESGRIARIDAGLAVGMDDVGLKTLRVDVRYASVPFRGGPQTSWFPVTASIELASPRQHWINLHRFTDYQRFSVETQMSVKGEQ